MFSKPRPNIIASTDGFSIQHVGRHEMHYKEGNKVLPIEVEGGFDPYGNHILIVYVKSIKWKRPFRESRREEILMNIANATLFDGSDPEFC
jgi:hypothetical protein